jgi:phosphoribosylamine--glycine ligase
MKVLIIGAGGREHAIADKLAENSEIQRLYCAPGNGGIREHAELIPISADDVAGLCEFARTAKIDLTFVGPEVPLSKGVVDTFQRHGLKIIGPTADMARLESSKTFAKNFLRTHNIPTADFLECSTLRQALDAVEAATDFPIVIKADGLAAGKGVVIAETRDEARRAVTDLMESRILGDAGARLVIEEFMSGVEASFLLFVDGMAFQPMVLSQDHKRRFDGDLGPNTGGMGAYSTDTILSPEQQSEVIQRIVQPTLKAARSYSGILYVGLMKTRNGPKVVEYNARFGDPETQVILPRLKTDLLSVFVDIAEHRLGSRKLEWHADVSATVVLVSRGYPGKIQTGKEIHGLADAGKIPGVKVYHAGTQWQDGKVYTSGGRVLNVTARGATLAGALERAYEAVAMIEFEDKDYRRDIGHRELVDRI